MTNKNTEWLTNLENAVPESAHGNRLSMYLIALEAWRRGIQVNFFTKDNPENKFLVRYTLSYNGKTHYFESSRGDKLTEQAYNICEYKDKTKRYIKDAGVKVPEGERFETGDSDQKVLDYADTLGYPVVLKPVNENAGKGVFSNIQTKERLAELLLYVRQELDYNDVILEEHVSGEEYRILVVNGKVVAVAHRKPANVIGDGHHTVSELIKFKNKSKSNNPNISKKRIKIDNEVLDSLAMAGYRPESVPKKDEYIQLREKSNISTGGDPVDVTDQFSDEIKSLAIKAVNSIPDLGICGLDVLIDFDKNTGTFIEINTKPMLGMHVFPIQGMARDVGKHIVDYYFPETKNSNKTNLYFDFNAIIDVLRSKLVQEIAIDSPPIMENMYAKKHILHGDFQSREIVSWLRKKALQFDFEGYIDQVDSNTVELVVAGYVKQNVDDFKAICQKSSEKITDILEYEWDKPVKVGFEIRDNKIEKLEKSVEKKQNKLNKTQEQLDEYKIQVDEFGKKIKQLQQNNKKIKQDKKHLLQTKNEEIEDKIIQLEELKKKHNSVLNSKSWRVTSPFRKVLNTIKKMFS